MRYLMRKQLFSIGEDFWVEDERGERVMRVDGKVLRVRQTFVLEDASGAELATIRKKLLAVRDTMDIERGGQVVARVRKALFAPFRQRFDVEVDGGPAVVVQGNITDHEYEVRRDSVRVAEISKRWFSVRDTYAVDVAPGEDVAMILALTVAVDWMGHEERGDR
ncbi:MAG TPA: LURP-one-related family protein [Candidatus Eisenbacteria bacterium]|nr:LURP-one-related family protein [Candidatus Eisenbacteria bacterium]